MGNHSYCRIKVIKPINKFPYVRADVCQCIPAFSSVKFVMKSKADSELVCLSGAGTFRDNSFRAMTAESNRSKRTKSGSHERMVMANGKDKESKKAKVRRVKRPERDGK